MRLRVLVIVLMIIGAIGTQSCKNDPQPAEMDCCCIPVFSGNGGSALPQPQFSQNSGAVGYGTSVKLLADSLMSSAVYEISLDRGETWRIADSTLVVQPVEIWGRTRCNNSVSEITKASYTVSYKRVLIVGNSITLHGPLPSAGWNGNWGMAASAAEKDYVHLISQKLRALNPNVDIMLFIAVDFESNYSTYDFAKVKQFKEFAPDLVIMRIAENVDFPNRANFEDRYARLIKELTANANSKVICTTSFWESKEDISYRIRNVARNKGYWVVDLQSMQKDKSYAAYDFFKDLGVGGHPSDKGMQEIADRITKYF